MKKTLFVISSLFLIGCATSNDMLYTQDEEQNLNLKEALPSVSNKMLALNGGEITLMDLDLNKPLGQPDGGGCTFETGYSIDNIYKSTAAFGPNPLTFFGYRIRGYGMPRTDGFLWKGIRFNSENRPKTVLNMYGQSRITNDPISSAIAIEFPFEANATYEITLKTYISDYIFELKHASYHSDEKDSYKIDKSQAFPTVALELKSSSEIPGADPCAKRPVIANALNSPNYYKRQKAEIPYQPYHKPKTFIFNFSTLENKNSLLVYFLPEISDQVLQSKFEMFLAGIKIIKKPFDPSHVVPPRVTTPDPDLPCGFRGGC
ncbi:hypothetical protein REB14_11845 [Chryseobacterium sp. ES2]|uniref:Uncharacterized protein n=1 Tax=Chryseobacterium metallicongregator TaxID=3073042 RepID=A0ABU1E523_9FLAO|nr:MULTISPECIES: hypothetical protein [Chryseobacterium]MDR4952866.1 hypothetical protein [Chryseobacterium sp. ES2]